MSYSDTILSVARKAKGMRDDLWTARIKLRYLFRETYGSSPGAEISICSSKAGARMVTEVNGKGEADHLTPATFGLCANNNVLRV